MEHIFFITSCLRARKRNKHVRYLAKMLLMMQYICSKRRETFIHSNTQKLFTTIIHFKQQLLQECSSSDSLDSEIHQSYHYCTNNSEFVHSNSSQHKNKAAIILCSSIV
ncbi:hypothetical protein AAHE18_15G053800 [Arachis hypogaea]